MMKEALTLWEFGCVRHTGRGRNSNGDHIIPLAKGGADTVDNMQLLHKACNLSKGAKLPIQDGEA